MEIKFNLAIFMMVRRSGGISITKSSKNSCQRTITVIFGAKLETNANQELIVEMCLFTVGFMLLSV